MKKSPAKILVVRNDKLGDFMLAWPSFAALKQAFPGARVVALVPNYTRPAAELCPWIDEILVDPTATAGVGGFVELLRQVRRQRFDWMVTLFSTSRVSLLGLLAGIPERWAPATKLAQLGYNHRLKQQRSRSEQPEYQYNLELTLAAIHSVLPGFVYQPQRPYLRLKEPERQQLRQTFDAQHPAAKGNRLLFIHAGHGGSANNLSLQQYAELTAAIARPGWHPVLTAGPGELEATRELQLLLEQRGVASSLFNSTEGLASFAKQLALADLFIAGSTGTLHIAGALDRPTVGFYPNRRSSTPLRWRTLNSEARYLAFTPPSSVEQDMSKVDLEAAALQIQGFMGQL